RRILAEGEDRRGLCRRVGAQELEQAGRVDCGEVEVDEHHFRPRAPGQGEGALRVCRCEEREPPLREHLARYAYRGGVVVDEEELAARRGGLAGRWGCHWPVWPLLAAGAVHCADSFTLTPTAGASHEKHPDRSIQTPARG